MPAILVDPTDFALLARGNGFELVMPNIDKTKPHDFSREQMVLLGVVAKLSDNEWCGEMAELGLNSLTRSGG